MSWREHGIDFEDDSGSRPCARFDIECLHTQLRAQSNRRVFQRAFDCLWGSALVEDLVPDVRQQDVEVTIAPNLGLSRTECRRVANSGDVRANLLGGLREGLRLEDDFDEQDLLGGFECENRDAGGCACNFRLFHAGEDEDDLSESDIAGIFNDSGEQHISGL